MRTSTALVLTLSAVSTTALAWNDSQIISDATGGKFKKAQGEYFDQGCGQSTGYHAEVIDLNNDGQPEVFFNLHGICHGGMAGVHMTLFIKGKDGKWQPQFGFPGVYTALKTRNKGYPDIEIGGPGTCFPIWRWNGRAYAIHKKCQR